MPPAPGPAKPANEAAEISADARDVVDKIDALVQPADEPENVLLIRRGPLGSVDRPALRRGVLSHSAALDGLPRRDAAVPPAVVKLRRSLGRVRRHPDDRTRRRSYLAFRRSRYLAIAAAATATLLGRRRLV